MRKKEKPLSAQEAVELARRELHQYWFGSEPLLVAVAASGKTAVYPLDASINERSWLLFFIDPASISAPDALYHSREWATRYEPQKLGVIVVLRSGYSFLKSPEWTRRWLNHDRKWFSDEERQSAIPVVAMDLDGLLAASFQVAEYPKLVLLDHGKVIFARGGRDWLSGSELELQGHLRKTDPGLPLFQVMVAKERQPYESAVVDFDGKALEPVDAEGKWAREADRWVTSDPKAALSFRCDGKRLGLLMASAAPVPPDSAPPTAAVLVEFDRVTANDMVYGEDLAAESRGFGSQFADPGDRCQGKIAVSDARLYRVFENLPDTHRQVILRFPEADRVPVAIYGLRFGE